MTSQTTICPIYKKCGGCSLQNMDYDHQLRWKQSNVNKLLGKYHSVRKIIGMENYQHYRCKVQTAFGYDKRSKKIYSGVFQSKTGRIIPHDLCLTEDTTACKIAATVRNLAMKYKIQAFDIATGKGFLRHTLIRVGKNTNQIMLVLVTTNGNIPHCQEFIQEITSLFPQITTIVQNFNCTSRELTLGERQEVLFGEGFITDTIDSLEFRISPKSFYQINPDGAQLLYSHALKMANIKSTDLVLDAYCGTGTITLLTARHCKTVIGVEQNYDAVRDAQSNAERNNIKNVVFYCADAGEFLEEQADNDERLDLVIMDPPRQGSSRQFLNALCSARPAKILYISCNIETLDRDLRYLTSQKYQVDSIQPVDMFPYTSHVETCVLLSHKNS